MLCTNFATALAKDAIESDRIKSVWKGGGG